MIEYDKKAFSLRVNHLIKSVPYDGGILRLLNDVTMHINASSISAIIGRSGAGKSTLLRCLKGLEAIDSGQILINGQDLTSLSGQARTVLLRQIGMIFQAYTLLSRKTVLENVLLPFALQGKVTTVQRQKALQLLEEVGLKDKINHYPAELSGGQRQRVAIARALVLDPGVLLCDELTSALDPKTTFEILALLKRINRDHGVTILLVTHDMNVVKEIADAVFVVEQGKIIEYGTSVDVLMKPQHAVTQQLVESTVGGDLPVFLLDCIKTDMSADEKRSAQRVMRLIFTNESSKQPIIAAVATQFSVNLSILAGALDHVADHMFGHLWVSCEPSEKLEDAIQYMNSHGVGVETMGYLSWNM